MNLFFAIDKKNTEANIKSVSEFLQIFKSNEGRKYIIGKT